MRTMLTALCAALILWGPAASGAAAGERASAPEAGAAAAGAAASASEAPNYTKLLETAKQAALAVSKKYESLRAAIRQASSPEAARKALDEMKAGGDAALAPYQRDSQLMSEVDGLLGFVKAGREEAEEGLKKSGREKRWLDLIEKWRQRGDNVSRLRQALINEGERGRSLMRQFSDERAYIENVLRLEGVRKAEEAMESALKDLKTFNDNLIKVIQDAKGRDEKILNAPGA
jgi:hypothetical protein